MDVGFDTVGNATLVVYDRGPLLVTDPWLGGDAYFGSWQLSHEVPEEQLAAAASAPYVWFSHGHPDHLNGSWLEFCRDKVILLPDHVGGRIKNDLTRIGLTVQVLRHATWSPLSERVRLWCFADRNQDAVLLVDIDGQLIVNLNDCTQTGWGPAVRREAKRFERSFLMQLSGYGSDMMNFTDENGHRIKPLAEIRMDRGYQVGDALMRTAEGFGITDVVPFSSMHQYQRADSMWASRYLTTFDHYRDGFDTSRVNLAPPYIRYDRRTSAWRTLDPTPIVVEEPIAPSEFGDDWSDELSPDDEYELRQYFSRVESFDDRLGFIKLVVGGRETTVDLSSSKRDVGITFRAPRGSLIAAARMRIFDDLLISNFMEATLHGRWSSDGLTSDAFGPYLTRYADNGLAYTKGEVRAYVKAYSARLSLLDGVRHALEGGGARLVRSLFEVDSPPYRVARRSYWAVKRLAR